MYSLAIASHRALNYNGGGRYKPRLSLVPMPHDQIDKATEFKRWLALFFIRRGKYKITKKGYAELAPKDIRQDDHIGEPSSARERSSRRDAVRSLTRSEIREAVAIHVEGMLKDGKTEELYGKGHVIHKADWKSKEIRVAVIKKFIEVLGKNPKEITQDDFYNNGLSSVLVDYYKGSPYLVLVEAGYAYSMEETLEHARTRNFKTDKIYPWEMNNVRIYHDKELRIAATKWLVWKLNKNPRDISADNFNNNGLGGLINHHYKGSPYLALLEAGLVTPADETYMRNHGHMH